jgi:cysteine synthase A
MKIYDSVSQLVGHTPLLSLKKFCTQKGLNANIIAKLEYFNPAGSVKDRVALEMISSAEREGKLKEGSVIIEPTSGNTGIGLAAIAVSRGYRTVIVMPDSMSAERQALMRAYGAELILTPGELGMKGAIAKAEELAAVTPNAIIAGQFENPANPEAHRKTTGPEIWEDTDGRVDMFVAGVGTGGTITGIGETLKAANPNMTIWAVEPENAAILSGGSIGTHVQMGIGDGLIPAILNQSIYDDVCIISDEEAIKASKDLARLEGIMCGISSGTNVAAAIKLAKKLGKGKTVVTVLPDTAERYFSTPLFDEL